MHKGIECVEMESGFPLRCHNKMEHEIWTQEYI